MNPLGLPFEMYDDFGRYRTQERLEYPENLITKVKDKGMPHEDLRDIYKTLPVDPSGYLDGSGDSSLDGDVETPWTSLIAWPSLIVCASPSSATHSVTSWGATRCSLIPRL